MYNSGYWIGYLIGAIAVGCIFGAITKHINESKGYDGGFAWGFWLGLIGIIVVALKADNNHSSQPYQPMYGGALSQNPPSRNAASNQWRCVCGNLNSGALSYCTYCRRSREEQNIRKKKCPHCGANNNESNETCFACGKPMNETAAPQAAQDSGVSLTKAAPSKETQEAAEVIRLVESLSRLHDQGILTDEEFQEKKASLLAKL